MRPQQRGEVVTTRKESQKDDEVDNEIYSHSGSRPSCVFISLIVLPVCNVSILARSGTLASRIRASFDKTFERCKGGALDHMPDWKTWWAVWMVSLTMFSDVEVTLDTKFGGVIGEVGTYVDMISPVAGLYTGILRNTD